MSKCVGEINAKSQNLKIPLKGSATKGGRERVLSWREKSMAFIIFTLGFILIISTLMDG
jgi:hypothetical protein